MEREQGRTGRRKEEGGKTKKNEGNEEVEEEKGRTGRG